MQVCASAGGPCYYVNVIVHGNGKVSSTEAENGMRVECPPVGAFTCTSDPWFNWADFANTGRIEFTASPTAGGTVFQGWGNVSAENGCPPDEPDDPDPEIAARVHRPTPDTCVFWERDLQGLQGTCLEANFSTGSQTYQHAGGCGFVPGIPVGAPVKVKKAGTGSGTVIGEVIPHPAAPPPPPPINCGAVCNTSIAPDWEVTLTATPASGSTFVGWSGIGGCPGTAPCHWTMVAGVGYTVTATFNSLTPPPPPPPPPPPNTKLFKKPPKSTKSRTARFFWAAVRGTTYLTSFRSQCRIDKKKAWQSCKSGKAYQKLKPGPHTFRVRAGTSASGWDPTPVVYSWKIKAK
jgi:hypothetical protein